MNERMNDMTKNEIEVIMDGNTSFVQGSKLKFTPLFSIQNWNISFQFANSRMMLFIELLELWSRLKKANLQELEK